MIFLKQSTQITLTIGPFVSSTDGYTVQSGLSIAQSDVRLSKNGGDFAQKNGASTYTYDEYGWYSGILDTTDTNTCGSLVLSINKSGALPVWKDFTIVNANVFDSLYAAAATDYLQVDVLQWSGTAVLPAQSNRPEVYIGANGVGVTTTGLAPAALSSIVASGNAAGWSNSITAVTVSGFTPAALGSIVTSGNAAGWNTTNANVTGLVPAALSQIVSSGNAAGWAATDGVQVTVTGMAPTALSQIVSSGNAAGWAAVSSAPVTVSGFTVGAITSASFNAGAIDAAAIAPNAIGASELAADAVAKIAYDVVLSGNVAGWNTTNANVTGLAPAALTQIVDSGNAAGWATLSTAPVTVSGFTNGSLGQIVSSGNAAGWNSTLVTVTGLAPNSVGSIVTGVFDEVLVGSLNFRTAQIEQWAYSANDVNLSGTSSGVYHSYYDSTDSGLFTLFATPSGRVRTDL